VNKNRIFDRPIGYQCFLCQQSFQYGPRVFDGRQIRKWDIMICTRCYDGNRQGIGADQYPRLMDHLKAKRIQYRLNIKGLIDLPG
jgi:hypothetical protein